MNPTNERNMHLQTTNTNEVDESKHNEHNRSQKITPSGKKLFDFLFKNKIDKLDGRKFTHTSLGYPKGSFELVDDNYRKFMDMYCKALADKHDLYLSEAHSPQGPILIDIDIKYHLNEQNDTHRYSLSDIELLMQLYNKYICKYLKVADEHLKIYLLEKTGPSYIGHKDDNKYYYKDGVHIMYPEICTPANIQHIIRDNVIKELKQYNHWQHLLMDNDLNDVLDKAVVEKNNWLMYGSGKPQNEQNNYKLSRIYNYALDGTMTTDTLDDLSPIEIYELPKTLSIKKYSACDITELNSPFDWSQIAEMYQEIAYRGRKKPTAINAVIENEIRIAKRLVMLLSQDRNNNYQQWIDLGFCLHNIHDSLLDTWVDFSSKHTSFKPGECEKMWNGFKDYGFTIKSLHYWAKSDNSLQYSDFMLEEQNDVLRRSLSGTSYDVAKAFYELNKYNYVCSDIKHKKWYEFKNHRWIEIDDGYTINHKLNEDMVNTYLKLAQIFANKALTVTGEEKDSLLTKQQQSLKLCKNLREVPFKNNIIKELLNLYYDVDFTEKKDENRKLLGFKNGVYDFESMIFRDGRPEDYITMSTHINYIPYDPNHPLTIEVLNFIRSIQEDPDMAQHLIDFWTSCCQGDIPDEKFYIWTGTGGNGKSLCINLAQKSFGDYAGVLPIAMLTNKRPPTTSASPELAKMKGKRFAMFQEAELGDTIYVGHMKELTSNNDKIQARFLNENPTEFYLQAKLLLTCNDLPEVSSIDGGTKRRLRIVGFDLKFVDNPTLSHERLIDKRIKDRLPLWAEYFMSILIHNYPKYARDGITEPEKIMLMTKEYQLNSDMYYEYTSTQLIKTKSISDLVTLQSLYDDFKVWFKSSSSGKCAIKSKEFKKQILEKLPEMSKAGNLTGYKLKNGITDCQFLIEEEEEKKNKREDKSAKKVLDI
jgi:P4 family phage/plasmid primase-like protien